jgi:putative permease
VPRAVEVVAEVLTTLVRYAGGQVVIALLLSVLYLVSFYFLGVPGWFLLAPLCGSLHIVPTVGAILGVAIPLLVIVIAGTSWPQVAGVVGVFATANLLELFVLNPVIHGKRLRLHPAAVFLAALAGGLLFGFLGAFFAVPVLAVAAVLWRRARGGEDTP